MNHFVYLLGELLFYDNIFLILGSSSMFITIEKNIVGIPSIIVDISYIIYHSIERNKINIMKIN